MSAVVFTRKLIVGQTATFTGNGDYHQSLIPDIYGHVRRHTVHTDWFVTEERQGRVLQSGTAWTRNRAWAKATAAAHRWANILRVTR